MTTDRQYTDANGQPVTVCSPECGETTLRSTTETPGGEEVVYWGNVYQTGQRLLCECNTLCDIEQGRPYVVPMVAETEIARLRGIEQRAREKLAMARGATNGSLVVAVLTQVLGDIPEEAAP